MPTSAMPPAREPTIRHLQQLTAQLLDGVILVDPAGTILAANAAALRMHGVDTAGDLGATAEEYAARFSLRSLKHRLLKHREYPLFRLLAGESFPDLVVEVAPAGEAEARWVHQVRDVVMDEDGGEPDCLALVLSDVSDRFDAEARFQAMFKANPAPALIVRQRDGRVARANPGFLSLTGFRLEQLTGRSLFGLDLLGGLADADLVRRQLDAGEVVPQTGAELLVASGSRRRVVFAGQPVDVTDEDALLLTFADLEPQRRALRAMEEAEKHLSAVFEMAPVAMTITRDVDHRINRANAAFRTFTGHSRDQTVGRTAGELGLWQSAEQRLEAEDAVRRQGSLRDLDARLLTADGAAIHGLVSAETISAESAACVLWLYQDVTERRRSEQELAAAIDEAMKDTNWLSRSILDRLAALRQPGEPATSVDLSRREREVLQLICDDLDDGEIARRLGLSRNTVRNHVARLYAKIGVGRRSAAVIWGRERGMGTSTS